ncbi:MAG: transglycosylase domain-containing protein [Bdellovibrionales bacterium]|nr:transglycosylase domain-containing protein [Bdellovibrionales bacterium]
MLGRFLLGVFIVLIIVVVLELFQGWIAASSPPLLRCQIPLPEKSIPARILTAILAQEDTEFFSHGGVNLDEVYSSIKENLNARRIVRGASTIDMQVAALCFRYPQLQWRWIAKVREMILSLFLQRYFTKDEILQMYVIAAPLGTSDGTEGFPNAALFYFQKELDQLTKREAWSLVTTLRNRERLNPKMTKNLHVMTPQVQRVLKRSIYRQLDREANLLLPLQRIAWVNSQASTFSKDDHSLVDIP